MTKIIKQRISEQEFLRKAKEAHGDKFSYENYTAFSKKVTVICKKHGKFNQLPYDHIKGHGCRKCYEQTNITWNEFEDDFLTKNYHNLGAERCAIELNKTLSATYSRAFTLKIQKKMPKRKHSEIPNYFMRQVKRHAEAKGREFNLNEDDIWEIFLKQNKVCALSGLPIGFIGNKKIRRTASLDRIDCKKGYTKDNVQLTHVDVNLSKRIYSDEYYIYLCKCVASFQDK